MPATLTTVSSILKEVYEPSITEQLNDEVTTLKRIERSSDGIEDNVGGKYVVFPIHTKRNQGIGARNEMEALPVAGQQGYGAGRINLTYQYGLVRLTGQTIRLADKKFQAFASALDQELTGIRQDLAVDLNRQVYGDASGTLTVVATLHASSVLITPAVGKVIYAQEGMQVDLIDGTTLGNPTPTVKSANRQVVSIDETTGEITLDAVVASAVGDVLVRTGNVNREWTGFKKMINSSGTVYNIDPTVEPKWKSSVDSNSGTPRALSEGLMISMADKIRVKGGKTTVIFQNLGVRRAYFNLLQQQRQFVNTKTFTGGFEGLVFTTDKGEIPVVVDFMAPFNTQYYVNEDEIKVFRDEDWKFMDFDGSNWQRVVGFDAYEATLFQYSQLGTHRRNTHGVIQDITEG